MSKQIKKSQLALLFITLLCIKIISFFIKDIFVVKFIDVMAVFVAYIALKTSISPIPLFILSWMAGTIEDILSGGIIGVNSISKLIMAFSSVLAKSKIEMENFPIQLLFAMILFSLDTIIKVIIVASFLNVSFSEKFIITSLILKLSFDTILFITSSLIFK